MAASTLSSESHSGRLLRLRQRELPSKNEGIGLADLKGEQRHREAVLRFVCEPSSDHFIPLHRFSRQEWQRLLHWLDISGLALYLLSCLDDLRASEELPQPVIHRLRENMIDNARRTDSMIEESVAIQHEFQRAGFDYAVLKGISLCPISVPRPELRHQFDLDYLVDESCIHEAGKVLERRGYHLCSVSGRTWEFKVNETGSIRLRDLYKEQPSFAVELHVESGLGTQPSRLKRVIHRSMYGMQMPTLWPVDLFLNQGLHAFKDVCSGFSRTAHFLEYYRHTRNRCEDEKFWPELHEIAKDDRMAILGIGVVTYLLSSIVCDFAPESLTSWTVGALSPPVRLWVDLYGGRAAVGDHPGTKLHLLLRKELEAAGVPGRRSVKHSLLPCHLPPAVLRASPHESLHDRAKRYVLQFRFFLTRLRFHVVEGARYTWESFRWRRRLERLS